MIRMVLSFFACACVLGACGGVGDDRTLTSLSRSELQDLCGEVRDAVYAPTQEESCRFGAVVISSTPEACESTVTACLMSEPTPSEEVDCSTADTSDIAAGCTATVGDYRACVDALAVKSESFYRVDCSIAGTDDVPSISELSAVPECALVMGCFDTSSAMMSSGAGG